MIDIDSLLNNKMSGEPYIPESEEEFDAMMKCWLPESDVPEKMSRILWCSWLRRWRQTDGNAPAR